jgi:hypothetical protein
MDILKGDNNQGAVLFLTASMVEESVQASQEENNMEEDSKEGEKSECLDESWQEDAREVSQLTAKIKKATSLLQLSSNEEEGSDFQESDISVHSDDLDLNLSDYESDALEVSLGEFDAKYVKKYANPKSFLHALWNAAGPLVGAMRICLKIIKEELAGQIAGVPAEFKDLPEQLINLMYEEAGEDPNNAMAFIIHVHQEISKFEDKEEKETTDSHVKTITYNEEAPAQGILDVGNEGTQEEASKTQGPLPGAQQTSPAEGAIIKPATEAGGDKEGVQSMSVAQGG